MITFLTFNLIYGLGNLYLFYSVSDIAKTGFYGNIFLGLFILLMTFSPIFIHQYTLKGSERTSRILLYIGYIWMAFVVVFSPFGALLDLYNAIARHSMFLSGGHLDLKTIPDNYIFFVPFFLSLTFNIYGYYEAKKLRVEKLVISTPKLPHGVDKVTIAQISDLHLGIISGDKTLNKVIREIKNAGPDLIVSTGDLIDGAVNHIRYFPEKLKHLQARLGKFAIIGNHEFYAGLTNAVKFIEESGFIPLRNSGVSIEGILNIAGVDDLGDIDNGLSEQVNTKTEREILSDLPAGIFTILLKHRSHVINDNIVLFDLQLSGHTHKGQIFPVNLIIPFLFKYHTGYSKLAKGAAIYVSRGAGTAGPPVRFMSPPELTFIEIVSARKAQPLKKLYNNKHNATHNVENI
jgi:hypothetical protein